MTLDEALAALQPWIQRHEKPCWHPVTDDGDGEATDSKFGGIPWLAPGEPWPTCQRCNHAFELMLQLNLSQLPPELDGAFGTGLLQLFYCVTGECDGFGGWEPFADVAQHVRIVNPQGTAGTVDFQGTFPPKRIVGWSRKRDRPDPEEHSRLGIEVDYHFKTVPYTPAELTCPEFGVRLSGIPQITKLHETIHSLPGDKLAGWPHWAQGAEYPACPRCSQPMRYVFQVDSEDHIPFMFGDCGTGHITQCATHKDVVAFGWACG
jgi:uncharacterized protein YwqG